METALIVAVLSGLPGIVAAFLVFKRSGQANNISDKAQDLGWVKELRQDALDTRKEMEALQMQVTTLRRQLATVSAEAEQWIAQYQALHRTIWRDGVSVQRLREYVGPPPPPPDVVRLNGNA